MKPEDVLVGKCIFGRRPKDFSERYQVIDSGCWLWIGPKGSNYGRQWTKTGFIKAHRYSYLINVGPIPDGMFVCHRCDTPACVNPKHLFLGTPKDNMQDMITKCRAKSGATRLIPAVVMDIYASKLPGRVLAKKYGVAEQTISNIRHGHRWKHLTSAHQRRVS